MMKFFKYLFPTYGKEKKPASIDTDILKLEERVILLEKNYSDFLYDIKRLEEENIEIFDLLYELRSNIGAVDNRIDILYGEKHDT